MTYKGVIIEESLNETSVLNDIKIIETKIEKVTPTHRTPWIKQWTLHTVIISEENADMVAKKISKFLDKEHNWYADYKNDKYHYIIYRDKVFKVDLHNPTFYKEARKYGISLGIPEYQVDFAPDNKVWERAD